MYSILIRRKGYLDRFLYNSQAKPIEWTVNPSIAENHASLEKTTSIVQAVLGPHLKALGRGDVAEHAGSTLYVVQIDGATGKLNVDYSLTLPGVLPPLRRE